MNDRALKILEYDKIKLLLINETGTELSAEMAEDLSPSSDHIEIEKNLRSTTEAVDLIVRKGSLPTSGLHNVKLSLSLAGKGGTLTIRQLLHILYNLRLASRIKKFMKSDIPKDIHIIKELTDRVTIAPDLEREIDKAILSEEELRDDASPELKRLRRGISQQTENIKIRLEKIANSEANRQFLQDSIVTVRDGRYVIPVKQEYRNMFPGMIHDRSKGGATLFIEPQSIVDMSNRLRELEIEEQAEVARILLNLSSMVAENAGVLAVNQRVIPELDFIMAKGKLSIDMDANSPTISDCVETLELKNVRHPLISKEEVVPINIKLGGDFNTLIVTGPNTGGKTVSLKTAGLMVLMAQSGLHIPASSMSVMPIYYDVFADIGDEQSIEQSLSTFSSHMKNIVEIMKSASENDMVLFDELGAGTDPTEGAALAIAILEHMLSVGAKTIATTHYNELKKYALSTEGVENASMEFDVETLSPTYRLLIGVPGKSNAFEISRKLGLDMDVIDRATELIERGDIEFEDVISSIEGDRKKAEEEREEADAILQEIKKREEDAKVRVDSMMKKTQDILSDARTEARQIIKDAGRTTKEIQKELRNLSKAESLGERNKRLEQVKKTLRDSEKLYAERTVKRVNNDPVKASDLKKGALVKILTIDQNGEVVSLPDENGDLQVSAGAMKIKVNLDDIMLLEQKKIKNTGGSGKKYGKIYTSKLGTVATSIDIRGKRPEEAVEIAEKYVDDVFLSGLESATIIHGVGTGVLKREVRKMLRSNRQVKSLRRGKFGEGGDGITIFSTIERK